MVTHLFPVVTVGYIRLLLRFTTRCYYTVTVGCWLLVVAFLRSLRLLPLLVARSRLPLRFTLD